MTPMWEVGAIISVFVGVGIVGLWYSARAAFLRPSGVLLGLTFVLFLLPHVFYVDRIADLTGFGDVAFLYTAVFALGNLLLVCCTLPYRAIVTQGAATDVSVRFKQLFLGTVVALGLILLVYFYFVPWTSTGLYALLFDSDNATLAREDSLKLLPLPWLQYLYLVGFSTLAPLVVACAIEMRFIQKDVSNVFLVLVAALVSLYLLITGARIGIANMVLVGFAWIVIRRGMRVHLHEFALFGVLFLAVPILMSVVREGVSEPDYLEYLEAVAERIFLLPTAITGWYVEYTNDFGFVNFFANGGNLSNEVALQYLTRHERIGADSVTTPTAYFIQNFAYFGWFGLIPSWIGLVLIDMPAQLAARLPAMFRRPLLAVLLYFSIILMQSGFGTTMISHGYFFLSLLIFVLYEHFKNHKR